MKNVEGTESGHFLHSAFCIFHSGCVFQQPANLMACGFRAIVQEGETRDYCAAAAIFSSFLEDRVRRVRGGFDEHEIDPNYLSCWV
jgi:hypothetical protein